MTVWTGFFLERIMLKLGLDQRWVSLATETITTASYSILKNGELKRFVTPTRGIKQGDPLKVRKCVKTQELFRPPN